MAISFRTAAPLLGLALSATTLGWAQETSSAQIEADLAFAEGLAAKWGFVDLAESVLEDLGDKGLSDRQKDQLALVRCSLYSEGGRKESDPAKRRELFDRALDEYKTFLDRNASSPLASQASADYVSAAYLYSEYLKQDLEDSVGEEAEALKTRQTEVLMGSVQLTGDAIQSLLAIGREERSARQTQQMYQLMLQRGQMLAAIAANADDSEFYYEQAMSALEELAAESGDCTPGAFYAFDSMGSIFAQQGRHEEAALFYDAVLDSTIPSDMAAWDQAKTDMELTLPQIELYFSFVQLSVDGSIESYLAQGDDETALERAMYFINVWKKEGISLNRNGQESLLVAARALLASNGFVGGNIQAGEGKWYASEEAMREEVRSRRDQTDTTTLATELATEVNETAAYGYLRTRAQKLLAEVSETPGVEVSPALQLEGVMGEYRSDNFDVAVDKALALVGTLQASEDSVRLELMPKLCNVLGNIYVKQERTLEAALAFREGVAKYAGGDLDMDGSNARAFNALMTRMVPATETTGPLAGLLRESEQMVTQHSAQGAGAILYRAASKLEKNEDWQGAITKYKQIDLDDDWGELALVSTGLCQVRLKKMQEAIATFDRFLNEIVPDPQYDTESPRRKANRRQSLATAKFYRAIALFSLKRYEEVITQLEGYADEHKAQDSLARSAYSLAMRAHLALGQVAKARQTLNALKDFAPDSPVTAKASTSMYLELSKQYKGKESTEEGREILRNMAELLELANSVGSADYGALWNEGSHWMDLGQDDKALIALRRVYKNFANDSDPETVKKVQRFVIPNLARLLLANHEINEASEMLTPLAKAEIDAEEAGTKSNVLGREATILFARSLAGWLEGGANGDPIVEVPGTGGDTELFKFAATELDNFARQRESFSCEWFELKFMVIYTTYQWSKVDTSLAGNVGAQLQAIAGQMSNTSWDDVDQICEDETDPILRERTTGHALRNFYRWLSNKAQ
ncbi:MAG: hypothetical protein KDB61_03640 [Planctomycetes bacterium]|nr:hypothetical protein [Planctomycetota bacterium]